MLGWEPGDPEQKTKFRAPHSTESGISHTELGESGNTQEHIQQEGRIRELPDSVQETPGLQVTGMKFMAGRVSQHG